MWTLYIYITLMALMWLRYKMTPRSFKGHFKVKVELTFSSWVATEDSHCYKPGQNNVFLPLKPCPGMDYWSLVIILTRFCAHVGDFEDDV